MPAEEFFLTVRLILVAMACTFAVGLPVTLFFLMGSRSALSTIQIWAVAPLVGVGTIILVSQNLLYLGVRSPHSSMALWVFALVAWALIIVSPALRSNLKPVPWFFLSLGVLVYLIHGSGLLVLGSSNYYGYGWVDMYNYVSQAQFFMDYPFSSVVADHEFLRTAQHFKLDRIGQSVLHAFVAASSRADAQQAFGATILLSPFLIFFALYLLISHLGIKNRFAYLAALGGALSPAVASVHLECFFSQAVAMPFLILLPLAVSSLITKPGTRSAVASALLFAAIATTYTELVVPLLVIVFAGLLICSNPWTNAFLHKPSIFGIFGSVCVSIIVALAINPGFFKGITSIIQRTNAAGLLGALYPWAFEAEGLARLWIGNQQLLPSAWIVKGLTVISLGFFLGGMGWLISQYVRTKSPTALFTGLIICFPLAPLLASVIIGSRYPYQFYKLLLTVWPLIICCGLCGIIQLASKRFLGCVPSWIAMMIIMLNLLAVNRIAYAASKTETVAQSGRGGAHLLIDEDFSRMRKYLDGMAGKQLFIWWYDKAMYEGGWRNGWLAYFARKNEVWSMNPIAPSGGWSSLQTLPSKLISGTEVIGITWKEMPIKVKDKIGETFWIYSLSSKDIKLVDSKSRSTSSRTLKLSVDHEMEANVWYPIWVAGKPGSATLITMKNASAGYQFRYDQWGHPATYLEPGGSCMGKDIVLDLKVMQFDNKIRLMCNDVTVEATIVAGPSLLEKDLPIRFGDNRGIGSLEGKYPLAPLFPGSIREINGNE